MTISKEKFDSLCRAGSLMSNVCYNLSQRGATLTDEEKKRLGELVRQWDATERAARPKP